MKGVLYFLAGALMGSGLGYLIWGRKKNVKKADTDVKEVESREAEETTYDDISKEKEVEEVVRAAKYVVAEDEEDEFYDEEDLQNDIEDIDDYICELEHPEDDDEPAPKAFEKINDDDFYTSKAEFDKIRLVLDRNDGTLMDSLGNDMSDMFARNGVSVDQLYFESNRGEDMVYYRCRKMDSDYEISVEEGDGS